MKRGRTLLLTTVATVGLMCLSTGVAFSASSNMGTGAGESSDMASSSHLSPGVTTTPDFTVETVRGGGELGTGAGGSVGTGTGTGTMGTESGTTGTGSSMGTEPGASMGTGGTPDTGTENMGTGETGGGTGGSHY
jgi:hypothetical protein